MTLQSTRAVELHPLCLSHPERLTLTIPLGIFDLGTTQNCSTNPEVETMLIAEVGRETVRRVASGDV